MKKLTDSHWSLLPHDILWQIIQRLDAVDYNCVSAVCRNYRWSCKTDLTRFIPNDQLPWLYIRRTSENSLVELYRPATDKTYTLDLPQISDTECYCVKDWWLLLRGYNDSHNLFLFNIFSKQKVCLPSLKPNIQWGHKVTFSTHQKLPNCVIVIIHGGTNFSTIYAWTKGATTWKRYGFGAGIKSIVHTWLSDDLLYLIANQQVFSFDKDLNLKRARSLKVLNDSSRYSVMGTTGMTSNIAMCNNKLYFYWKERHGVYKFDCSAMGWTMTDDARNSIWCSNASGSGGSGVMVEGNLINTESLLNNLIRKGYKVDRNTFIFSNLPFNMIVRGGNEASITQGTFRVIGTTVEKCMDWNWMSLE